MVGYLRSVGEVVFLGLLMVATESAAQTRLVNVASSSLGGAVEQITDDVSAGFAGRLLIDGNAATTWQARSASPQEIVLSFFNRQPVLLSAVHLTTPTAPDRAPSRVEVWASSQGADGTFSRVGTLVGNDSREQELAFKPVTVTYLKLIIHSPRAGVPAELAEIQALESSRPGYKTLAVRNPTMSEWERSPRYAAQRGVDWLAATAVDWQRREKCFGCHVQGQVVTGLAIAKRNGYRVSAAALAELMSFTRAAQNPDGSFHATSDGLLGPRTIALVTTTQFAVLAMAHGDDVLNTRTPELAKAVDYLLTRQTPEGEIASDHHEPPIDQGSLMTTTNASIGFDRAYRQTGDVKYRDAAERALSWVAKRIPETTQDKALQVVALSRFGNPERRQVVNVVVEQLKAEQREDGGWSELRTQRGSNAFATGQVLYAFKSAGVSVDAPEFRRGVEYLRATQREDGSWPLVNTQSGRPSQLAATMWAVIGLGASFRDSKSGSIQVVSAFKSATNAQKLPRNVLLVLDGSGSMNRSLGATTRIATARQVVKKALDRIPSEYRVGVRLYAHRAQSRSKETCTDTELVVPITPLDRATVARAIDAIEPRGDTPLVYSILQGVADLKAAGGGSLIVVTDGEETCGGDWRAVAAQVQEAGIDMSLSIVGFGLQSPAFVSQLKRLANAAGGHYLGAPDGEGLLQSLSVATARYPFTVLDSRGRKVARGTSDTEALEVPPGMYRVVVHAIGRDLLSEPLSVSASGDTVLTITGPRDSPVLQR